MVEDECACVHAGIMFFEHKTAEKASFSRQNHQTRELDSRLNYRAIYEWM